MTVADVERVVAKIESMSADDEGAHAEEDSLHEAVLTWIAKHGDEKSAELAAAALKTGDIDFARWCA